MEKINRTEHKINEVLETIAEERALILTTRVR